MAQSRCAWAGAVRSVHLAEGEGMIIYMPFALAGVLAANQELVRSRQKTAYDQTDATTMTCSS